MPNNSTLCAYCGEKLDSDSREIAAHITHCDMRPELGLVLKIQLLQEMGDDVLRALHETISLIAQLEGPRAKSWEIYRIAQEGWEIAKETSAVDLMETAKSDMQEASDVVNDR
jgi:hypothetical protein